MAFQILTGNALSVDFLPKVMELDIEAYKAEGYEGQLENMVSRFEKNPRSFVCVMDGDELAAYINFFPVIEPLWEEIVETGMELRDDDILPEEVALYCKGGDHRLFIISVVVKKDRQQDHRVVRMLTDAWIDELNALVKEGFPISAIAATAVSADGRKFLRSRLFHQVREIQDHNCVYVCEGEYLERLLCKELYFKSHKDDVYLLIPFAENTRNPHTQQLFSGAVADRLNHEWEEWKHEEEVLEDRKVSREAQRMGISEDEVRLHHADAKDRFDQEDFYHLLDELNDCINYECSNDVRNELQRFFLGRFMLLHTTDDYAAQEDADAFKASPVHAAMVGEERVYVSLLAHRPSHMYVVTVLVPNCRYDTSQVIDQMIQGYLMIRPEPHAEASFAQKVQQGVMDDQGHYLYMPLGRYLESNYGLLPCGPGKVFVCLSNRPEKEQEFLNILAGEAYFSMRQGFHIDHELLRNQARENLAVYDYYEAYMSEKVITFIFKNFQELTGLEKPDAWESRDHFRARTELTATYVFIMELIMFQNTAMNKMTMKVSNALAQDGDVSYDYMNDLYRDYARSAKFWQNENFRYLGTQKEATQIRKAFANDEVRENYQELQSFLEDMINLQSAQDERRTGTMINVIATILAIMQVQGFVVSILQEFYEKFGIPVRQADHSFTTTLVGGSILFLLVWFILQRKRSYERKYKIREHYRRNFDTRSS